jgi:gluconate 2-dehydrogenase gamma chain
VSGQQPGRTANSDTTPDNVDYKPTFFTAREWTFVRSACERLIPNDDHGPGALEAGVPEFIDRQMNTPYAHGALWYMQGPFREAAPELGRQSKLIPREVYRLGISAVDAHCRTEFGKDFADLPSQQRDAVLSSLEKGKIELAQVPAKLFFGQLLQNTREGFFCDPIHGGNKHMIGWKFIGFPGARADFMDFVNQGGKRYPYGPASMSGEKA